MDFETLLFLLKSLEYIPDAPMMLLISIPEVDNKYFQNVFILFEQEEGRRYFQSLPRTTKATVVWSVYVSANLELARFCIRNRALIPSDFFLLLYNFVYRNVNTHPPAYLQDLSATDRKQWHNCLLPYSTGEGIGAQLASTLDFTEQEAQLRYLMNLSIEPGDGIQIVQLLSSENGWNWFHEQTESRKKYFLENIGWNIFVPRGIADGSRLTIRHGTVVKPAIAEITVVSRILQYRNAYDEFNRLSSDLMQTFISRVNWFSLPLENNALTLTPILQLLFAYQNRQSEADSRSKVSSDLCKQVFSLNINWFAEPAASIASFILSSDSHQLFLELPEEIQNKIFSATNYNVDDRINEVSAIFQVIYVDQLREKWLRFILHDETTFRKIDWLRRAEADPQWEHASRPNDDELKVVVLPIIHLMFYEPNNIELHKKLLQLLSDEQLKQLQEAAEMQAGEESYLYMTLDELMDELPKESRSSISRYLEGNSPLSLQAPGVGTLFAANAAIGHHSPSLDQAQRPSHP